jgi:hypothetical protein
MSSRLCTSISITKIHYKVGRVDASGSMHWAVNSHSESDRCSSINDLHDYGSRLAALVTGIPKSSHRIIRPKLYTSDFYVKG